VVAQASTEGTPADEFSKGDVFVVANIPHVVAANGDPAVDNPLAQANAVPGELEGTVEAAYILDRVPMDVLEVLSCLPVEDRAGAFVVQAKLIHRLPARVSLAGLSPAATTDVEAPIGTVCVFTWDEDTNVALLPTDQMITSMAGGIKPTKDAGKRGQGVEGGAPGEQPRVFNGVMTDLDGMFLLCVDKANFQKEEKRSRPCRRAMSQQRTQALLGDRAYVLDEDRVKRELQAAFNDPLGTEVPKWAEDSLTSHCLCASFQSGKVRSCLRLFFSVTDAPSIQTSFPCVTTYRQGSCTTTRTCSHSSWHWNAASTCSRTAGTGDF
jgi:hypothetical protein